jgi:hypothetical protein
VHRLSEIAEKDAIEYPKGKPDQKDGEMKEIDRIELKV